MISILRTEMFRLLKSKLFWVLLCVCIILPCISATIYKGSINAVVSDEFSEEDVVAAASILNDSLSTGSMLNTSASISSTAAMLAVICSAVILCREFTGGTMRNVLLAHKSRIQMYCAYFTTAMVIGGSFFTVNYFTTFATISPVFGFGKATTADVVSGLFVCYALGLCAVLFLQSCVCMFMFTTRKQAATIAFPLLIGFLLPSVVQIIVYAVIFARIMDTGTMATALETKLKFVPFYNTSMFNPFDLDTTLTLMCFTYYLVFAAMFWVCGYFVFKKADLK